MNVVVDTNVLVAGLLSPFGPPGEILRMIASGAVRLCFDARILTEYEEVLARPKFRFNAEQTRALMDCVFRPKPATDSDASRPPLPTERGR